MTDWIGWMPTTVMSILWIAQMDSNGRKDAASYRKISYLVTAEALRHSLPWNSHSQRACSWSTKIFEANIFVICKALLKFMKYCLIEIWSDTVLVAVLLEYI